MFDWQIYLGGLAAMGVLALVGWGISVAKRNVTLVDSLWSLFFLLGSLAYVAAGHGSTARQTMLLVIVFVWSARLCGYLSWRNRGPHEDKRYQAIRRNNEPRFWLKSLYLVFGLQAVLAWIVSLPLLGVANSSRPLNWLDLLGLLVWLFGLAWETIGDWQLARFKANPAHRQAVMDGGLWKYSRHPNYFGECCLWWGYYLLALASGAWWSLPGPLLMTLLLLKVSGVALLEKEIGHRRPAYDDYIRRTNAFLPGKPKKNP